MIAIAHDGVGGVADGPVFEVEVVVVGILSDGPAVEHLVHDEEAHAVSEVEELGRGRVVRSADGVDTELAELGEAALPDAEGDGGADCATVGVEGYAVDLVMNAVEEEALVGVEMKLANAEGHVLVVDGLAVAQQRGVDGVECAVGDVPAVRIGNGDFGIEVGDCVGREMHGGGGGDVVGGYGRAAGAGNVDLEARELPALRTHW